jgi:hypothetical protein
MLEDLFQYIWKMKLFNTNNLFTTDGEPVEIINVGTHNMHSGPDFFNSKIKIDQTIWAGNVELHVKSSDWLLHKHQHDAAFDNIILHVVYENDKPLFHSNGQAIKTLILAPHIKKEVIEKYSSFKENNSKIACEKSVSKVPSTIINTYLDSIVVKRLHAKSKQIENLLLENNNNWEQSFYLKLASNFSFKINQVPFELLARTTPLSILAKHKGNLTQLEALLFGQSGLLNNTVNDNYSSLLQNEYVFLKKKYQLNGIDSHLWKFSKMRPVNFPTIRISQFASLIHQSSHLFSKILTANTATELMQFFKISASEYWNNHYTFQQTSSVSKKNLGLTSVENILINTVIPFVFVYGKHYGNESKCELALQLLEKLKPEKNNIISLWNSFGITAKNALQSQALIELKNKHCDEKKCLHCTIGHYLIKNN